LEGFFCVYFFRNWCGSRYSPRGFLDIGRYLSCNVPQNPIFPFALPFLEKIE